MPHRMMTMPMGEYDRAAALEAEPQGGYYNQGGETRGGLEGRAGMPGYTHRHDPNMHKNRTLCEPGQRVAATQIKEGDSFSMPMRADLDDDVLGD